MSDIDAPEISIRRLLWVGPATVAAAVVAVDAVQWAAAAVYNPLPKGLRALGSSEPTIVATVCVVGAVLVFAVTARESINPVRMYRRLAFVVLLISFVPDVILAETSVPEINLWPLATIFMVMHIVAWSVTVTMLTRLTVVQHGNVQSAIPQSQA